MTEKIDRYSSMVFEGQGYIKDHHDCRKIVKLDFPMYEKELADKLRRKILEWLNEERN